MKEKKETHILPLLLDLTNPSPGIRLGEPGTVFFYRAGDRWDLILSLALVHHLAISNNVPLGKMAAFFSKLCDHLVMEFVPKEDSQVQRLLATREDVFANYTQEDFEKEFSLYFTIRESVKLKDSLRILYLLRRKK